MTRRTEIVERVAEFDGVRTRVLEVAGEGPPVLLLHGFTDSADSWRPLLLELAGRSRRAIAVDMPGSGHAPALARPALAALDRFGAGLVRTYAQDAPAVLVGNSLGGLVALRAAQREDLPLLAVMGLGPAGLAYHSRLERFASWCRRFDPLLQLLERVPVPAPVLRHLAAVLYHVRLAERQGDPSLARRYASHLRGFRDVGRLRGDLLALSQEADADPLVLDAIRVPVLLVWGMRDRLASVAGAPALLDAVPDSRLVIYHDCGHCPQIQRPGEIADLIADLPASASRRLDITRKTS
jgi:pimeloyl-ACP methyl ester carboxylesterase